MNKIKRIARWAFANHMSLFDTMVVGWFMLLFAAKLYVWAAAVFIIGVLVSGVMTVILEDE